MVRHVFRGIAKVLQKTFLDFDHGSLIIIKNNVRVVACFLVSFLLFLSLLDQCFVIK